MFSSLDLKEEYRTGEANLVTDFYLPCLNQSDVYQRSVGYFSSTVFLLIGPELINFARKGGKIQLVCSPSLSAADIDALEQGYGRNLQKANQEIIHTVDTLLSDPRLIKNTEALATLIKLNIMQVKIAFRKNSTGIYHEKLGILTSNTSSVSFKGSVNETWSGWHERGNYESLDVFCSWKDGRDERQVERHKRYFEKLWANQVEELEIIDFPLVAKNRLEAKAYNSLGEIDTEKLTDYFSLGNEYEKKRSLSLSHKRKPLPHQVAALEAWETQNYQGIFEHATGSGKTFTALTALKEHLLNGGVAIVLVPDRLLHKQWTEEIKQELPDAIILKAGDGYNRWRKNRRLYHFTQLGEGLGKRIVLATMPTARLNDFINGLADGNHLMVVADEVHEIGSIENSKALSIRAGKKLGLSATPTRYSDAFGTQKIIDYFGPIVQPPFTLIDAIKSGRLVEYEYLPEAIRFTVEESEAWETATKEISKEFARSKRDDTGKPVPSVKLQNMLIQRARIAKKAKSKVPYAIKTIIENYKDGESWLVYCEDQYQLKEVMEALMLKSYSPCEYHTNMEGDPAASLDWFKQFGGIMVSIRCLDQGVDIPKISHAIILASSQNPRQFIQRRGRVLRTCPGKYKAVIFDAVMVPVCLESEPGQLSLLKSELQRSIQFSKTAINKSGSNKLINIAIELGIDPEEVGLLDSDGIEEETS
ncbi:DEAD/DEAH box helicase family protein [Pseudoalteromonas sp. MMG010]|uniref:DEAD/DEAH box helicase family protein n=1 Tax=Pseudoalteromonas sp. MMG010 TaxID=2822685 RepID=UPI001B3A3D71|nr:DEAD/DEAH box helicase family protein [Pseudoalteromonas sp. MMG010]MBQ4833644.1 DEAD/DEAH box helicase family protein [Pseudoalteromonas sp. MMG010]